MTRAAIDALRRLTVRSAASISSISPAARNARHLPFSEAAIFADLSGMMLLPTAPCRQLRSIEKRASTSVS